MISASGIVKKFSPNGAEVIKDVNLEIFDGDFISLMGRSGSGKSTLLYLLSTLDRSFTGEVTYDHENVKKMNTKTIHSVRNKQIGFVFQFHYLLSELSALENILLPARKAGLLIEKRPFARELLAEVELLDKADRLPAQLSGGEQQRVAIARALIMRPKYLFADEPTGNLDSVSGGKVLDLFEKFNKEYGTSIIYVTHDKIFGERAKRKIHLTDGKLSV